MDSFVHLHVHSQYSILDGQASIKALVDKALQDGMPAMALTDHGNMFGIKEFYNYVKKKNAEKDKQIKDGNKELKTLLSQDPIDVTQKQRIETLQSEIKALTHQKFKPIIGCEMYVAREGLHKKEVRSDQRGHHLVVLAKNKIGYHNLVKLVSKAWTEGFYSMPRTDKTELEKHREGLIICSACLAGEVPDKLRNGDYAGAEESVLWFQQHFGEDYYLELQRHKATQPHANHEAFMIQQEINPHLIELARKHNIKLVATNDVHFVEADHAEAHDRLICLSTGKDLDDPKRMLYSKQEWMKTTAEMKAVFEDISEAISNTLEVADKVEYYSIDSDPILPNFPKPEGFDNDDDYLKHLTYEGAKKRWGEPNEEQKERLDFELNTIKGMGYPGYFLIVQDFIAAARSMGVSVGPGRGSAAGSAVAYCLGITQIDPIQYDLLFERFLNPDRISLPDIDIDFDDDGRGEVLRWVTDKYGYEKVAHIITYGTMATKSSIKDVARVQKLPLPESERLTKLVPDRLPELPGGKKIPFNLTNIVNYVPQLKEAEESDNPILRDTIKYAKILEGNVRNIGVHACGIIIGRDDITDWVPVSTADDKETGEKMLVTQYEGSVIEETGLIKMDFLGLKTLSIIKEAIQNIRLTHGMEIDIDTIPIDDPKTYQLYSEGNTIGTFQFESAGMQKYLKELKPTTFEDLIAMNALYRPGPMDYIPQFIARKHGNETIEYDIPVMEKYLKDTYGITVYQEQVMLLSRLLADFTRGESDALRKAMGKKLKDKLDAMRPQFINGGAKNGYDQKVLEKIWTDWEKFASYAFNKSHATCYSWIAYQTAYLKANYPSQYMAAVLSRNISDIAGITKFMDECKAMGIEVLGPDVNESHLKFTVNKKGNIRFGLGAIKGVGAAAVEAILQERQKNGPFQDIYNFVERVNLSACNKKSIESMALAGSFDSFEGIYREMFVINNIKGESFLENIIRYGNKFQIDQQSSSTSLFGDFAPIEIAKPEMLSVPKWPTLELLNKEREYVGIYLSAHPLDDFQLELKFGCNVNAQQLADKHALLNRNLVFGGLVTGFNERISKSGAPFGFLTIEDFSGSIEIPFFGKDFLTFRNYFKIGLFLLLRGKVQPRSYKPEEVELKIHQIDLLQEVKDSLIRELTLALPLELIDETFVEDLTTIVQKHPGNTRLCLRIKDVASPIDLELTGRDLSISLNKELVAFVDSLDGVEIVA